MQNCYKSGKIPREVAEDQDGRLTTKHIQTLSFLQEMARENQDLKEKIDEMEAKMRNCKELHDLAENAQSRIKQIQQEYLDRADEMRKTLTDKFNEEIMRRVEEKVEAEQRFVNEKAELQKEIDRLRKENRDLQSQTGLSIDYNNQIQTLQKEISALRASNKSLSEEKLELQTENNNQMIEIQRLQFVEEKNERLVEEINEANQKIKELELRLARQEREAGAVGAAEQEELMAALRVKLHKLHKEKSVWVEKEKDYVNQTEDLKSEVGKLRRALSDSERMREDMHEQLDDVIKELNWLKRKFSEPRDNNKTFADFVKVKRELNNVKDENDFLKDRLKSKKGVGLPRMLEAGDAASKMGSGKKDPLLLYSKGK